MPGVTVSDRRALLLSLGLHTALVIGLLLLALRHHRDRAEFVTVSLTPRSSGVSESSGVAGRLNRGLGKATVSKRKPTSQLARSVRDFAKSLRSHPRWPDDQSGRQAGRLIAAIRNDLTNDTTVLSESSGSTGTADAPILDSQEIRLVLDRNQDRFRECYERVLLRESTLSGRAEFAFAVAPGGAVASLNTDVMGSGSSSGRESLRRCLESVGRGLRFPTFTQSYRVKYQLSLLVND